jgi:hypothetical protein
MITPEKFVTQSKKIANLRSALANREISLKKAKRELERYELELLSANPPQGSNETARKMDKERILHTDKQYLLLDEKVFAAEIERYETEHQLEAEKDIRQGLEWAVRCEIARGLPENVTNIDRATADMQADFLPPEPPCLRPVSDYYDEGGH